MNARSYIRITRIVFAAGLLLLLSVFSAYAQKPPRPVTITPVATLSFGAFYQSGAGTVSVDYAGARTWTGGIITLGSYIVSPAILRITGNPGTRITLTMGPDIIMNGDGGGTVTLHLDPVTDPVSPFVLTGGTPSTVDLHLGGTIDVPAARPRGSYSGTFTIIFNQD
jgi:hypothetical protein